MRTYEQRLTYEQLELTSEQKHEQKVQLAVLPILKKAGNFLLTFLTEGTELRIRETSDRFGHSQWHVRDPQTGRSVWLSSEAEVRTWIEKRPYYKPSDERWNVWL